MSSQANNDLAQDDKFRVKVEFAVNISAEDDLNKIENALSNKVRAAQKFSPLTILAIQQTIGSTNKFLITPGR